MNITLSAWEYGIREQRLRKAIEDLLDTFRALTGVTVTGIRRLPTGDGSLGIIIDTWPHEPAVLHRPGRSCPPKEGENDDNTQIP